MNPSISVPEMLFPLYNRCDLKTFCFEVCLNVGRENNDSLDCCLKLFAVSTTEGLLDMTTALQTVFFLLLKNERASSRCVTMNW